MSSRWPSEVLEPDDIAMLERILKKLPQGDSAEREWLASALVAAFQARIRDEELLLVEMRDKISSAPDTHV